MSRKGRKKKKAGGGSPSKTVASGESEAETAGNESVAEQAPTPFAALMSDARRIEPGPKRAKIPPAASPAVARARATRDSSGASGEDGTSGFRWPDPEDRSRAAAEGVSDTALFALSRGEPAPEERIDLHGARRDAASRLVAKRLESARSRGLRCVLIVHGHGKNSGSGEAVLKEALPGWLAQRPSSKSVLAFAPAPRNLGGEGATMVLIRRR